ncbi:hypothetical protein KL922_004756 [Ogataea haglerorum]|nr:hypothetical protein KL922_004756 [Ogataea haglerorum]
MALDIFDINGPFSVCAESLQFWGAVLDFCQPAVDELRDYFPDNKRRLRSRIVDWVLYKGFRPATVGDARAMAGFLGQGADLGHKYAELEAALRGGLREMRPSREAVCWALLLCEMGVLDEESLPFEPAFVVNCAATLGVAPRFVFSLDADPLDKLLLRINSGLCRADEMAALARQLDPAQLLIPATAGRKTTRLHAAGKVPCAQTVHPGVHGNEETGGTGAARALVQREQLLRAAGRGSVSGWRAWL